MGDGKGFIQCKAHLINHAVVVMVGLNLKLVEIILFLAFPAAISGIIHLLTVVERLLEFFLPVKDDRAEMYNLIVRLRTLEKA